MHCPNCATDNLEHATFCRRCGVNLRHLCRGCGAANLAHFRHCVNCGARLEEPDAETVPQAAPAPESSSTPTEPVIEGERKHVSVLFADISGSLALIRDSDPEEARALFDAMVEATTAVIHRYKGTVNRVMGDGVMALFGAPVAQEQHAVNATFAALEILAAIAELNRTVRLAPGVTLVMHIGVDTGEVVVRPVTTDLHTEYDAVGRAVHIAARLQALAPAGAIRISAATARQVEGFVLTRPLGTELVKGLLEPLEIFEPIEPGPAATRFDRAKRRGLSKLVARGRELAALNAAAESVADGGGQLWATIGDPGTGKSRLVHEFLSSPPLAGWRIVEASCAAYGRAASVAPIAALLRSCLGIGEATSREEILALLAAALATRDDHALIACAALTLLGSPVEDPAWQRADAALRREAVESVLSALLLPASASRPVVVVLQDLHWIDTESERIFDRLVRDLPRSRVVVLVNFRPEYRNPWRRLGHAHELSLDPLSRESARLLLDDLLENDAGLGDIKEMLLARTAGNPLFIEESVRALMDSGALTRSNGRLTLSAGLDRVRIPHTVQSILAARIDLISPRDKAILQIAAVIGDTVSTALLFYIAVEAPYAVAQSLTRLIASGFLAQAKSPPEEEFVFNHPLIHEVVYDGVLKSERRRLHREILAAMERLHATRRGELALLLAEHARRGEVWEKCAFYLRMAGLNAYGRSANAEAARLFEQAVEALESAPPDRANDELLIDLCLDLRNSLLLIGEIVKILTYLARAEAVARELQDGQRLAKLASNMSHAYWVLGDTRRALQYGQEAVRVADALVDPVLAAQARYHVALVYSDLGQHREANRRFEELIGGLEGARRHDRFGLNAPLSVLAGSYLARSLAEIGEFDAALSAGWRILAIGDEIDHAFARAMARLALGYAFLVKTDHGAALQHLEEARDLFATLGNRTMLTVVGAFLGRARLLLGESDAALRLLEESVTQSESIGLMSQQPMRMAFLAECHRLFGRTRVALSWTEQAVRLARQQQELASEAYALWAMGRVLADGGEGDARIAARILLDASRVAHRAAMRPLAAICRLDLAGCYRRCGKDGAARHSLVAARRAFAELEMPRWEHEAAETGARSALA